MYKKPKISHNTVRKNKKLGGFIKKPEGKALEEEEEVES
jgi:hypothetical protein